jgi:PPIC-type PPIASE domain
LKASFKVVLTFVIGISSAIAIIAAQSCQFGKSDSFSTLSQSDLTSIADTLPDQQKRSLAQNENQRKQFLKQMTQMFSLAQAAQKEGLDKSENFKRSTVVFTDNLLVSEYLKRNPDAKFSEEQAKAYAAAHEKDFQADLQSITEGGQQPPADQIEMMKLQWGEMKVRAEQARKAGIDKDPALQLQMKFQRANRLANAYSAFLEKKLKPTPEELKKYLEEHPEADLAKIKAKADDLLKRVRAGESFEELAKQNTEDGTRDLGGDLGWYPRGKWGDPEFEKATFALKKGETSEVLKTKFGYHIVRLDDRRIVEKKPTPPPPTQPASATPPAPTPSPEPAGPVEEVKARHIFLSTQEADGVETVLSRKKVQRALDDTTLEFPVQAPADFTVNVGGLRRDSPGIDTGSGRIITPKQ